MTGSSVGPANAYLARGYKEGGNGTDDLSKNAAAEIGSTGHTGVISPADIV
jgi:expansin (peptidoglycan-binding protein)